MNQTIHSLPPSSSPGPRSDLPNLDEKGGINWFHTSLGQALLKEETERCRRLIPAGYYPTSVQVGMPVTDFLGGVGTGLRIQVIGETSKGPEGSGGPHVFSNFQGTVSRHPDLGAGVIADETALPFPERSVDLMVLPHTLDFSEHPHEVLRQVSQILSAEGCVVVVGFNLLSIYGLIRGFSGASKPVPWNGQYYSVSRIQDWLTLLGFDVVGAGMMAYRPPFQHAGYWEKMAFMEHAGDRWWPGLGGVYVIVGRKRELSVSSGHAKVARWRQLLPAIARPAASSRAARQGLKLVRNKTDR